MPGRGLLAVTYYSGEGKNRKGCRPYVNFRKSLLNLVFTRYDFKLRVNLENYLKVLINENEIVKEEVRSKPAPALMNGDRAFEKHIRKLH